MLTVLDHTDAKWQRAYLAKPRENGAATYSREIVRYHLPFWESWSQGRQVYLSTCPLIRSVPHGGDVAVQYLHEFRMDDPLFHARVTARATASHFSRTIFVVAYEHMAQALQEEGLSAIYLPMAIEVARVQRTPRSPLWDHPHRAAYFGNVTRPKRALYATLRASLAYRGWELDHVLERRQEAAWARLRAYRFGVGVGRCALEMGALGMQVMIAGANFGGLMTEPDHVLIQRSTNMNGRLVTHSASIDRCIQDWQLAVPGVTYDVKQAVDRLEEILRGT